MAKVLLGKTHNKCYLLVFPQTLQSQHKNGITSLSCVAYTRGVECQGESSRVCPNSTGFEHNIF